MAENVDAQLVLYWAYRTGPLCKGFYSSMQKIISGPLGHCSICSCGGLPPVLNWYITKASGVTRWSVTDFSR